MKIEQDFIRKYDHDLEADLSKGENSPNVIYYKEYQRRFVFKYENAYHGKALRIPHQTFVRRLASCFEESGCMGVKIDDVVVIPPIYEMIKLVPNAYSYYEHFFFAIVRKTINGEKKYGLLSDNNEIICQQIYDDIQWWKRDGKCYVFKLKKGDDYYCYDVHGNQPIFDIEDYSYIGPFIGFDQRVRQSAKNEVNGFVEELKLGDKRQSVVKRREQYGIILNDGTVVIPTTFQKIRAFSVVINGDFCEMRADVVFDDGVSAWVDYRGFIFGVIPNTYKSVRKIKEDRFIVKNNQGECGIMDSECRVVCDLVFDNYREHADNDDYVSFHDTNGWCIVDVMSGKRSSAYYEVMSWGWSGDYLFVSVNNKCGVISMTGQEVVPCLSDSVFDDYKIIRREDRFVFFHTVSGWCVVDVKFGKVISDNYDWVSWIVYPEYLQVSQNGKEGVIKVSGEVVVPCVYDKLIGCSVNERGTLNAYEAYFEGERGCLRNSQFALSRQSYKTINKTSEKERYDHYGGTYAQDEAGYSDDDIDTIFDGDPSAYWNID